MNLVDKLMRIDIEEVKKRDTKTIKCERLSKVLGEDAEITIQALGGRKLNDLMQMIIDEKGNKVMSKMYDLNLMLCVEGIVEPSMKDDGLKEHFNAATPKDLASILFEAEAASIASEITSLSGLRDDAEKEIKNSFSETEM